MRTRIYRKATGINQTSNSGCGNAPPASQKIRQVTADTAGKTKKAKRSHPAPMRTRSMDRSKERISSFPPKRYARIRPDTEGPKVPALRRTSRDSGMGRLHLSAAST